MTGRMKTGDRLQVLNEVEQEYYMTRVQDMGEDFFTIAPPVSGGKKLDMPEYSSWQFCLIRNDAVYFFSSRVTGVSSDLTKKRYMIIVPETLHRQQRRSYVRVSCHCNILYWRWEDAQIDGLTGPAQVTGNPDLWDDPLWLEDYLKELEGNVAGKNSFTLDMSGGGLRMVTLEPLEKSKRILLKLELDNKSEKRFLLLEARVVRIMALNIGGWKRYRVGISFAALRADVREKIISYLFKEMRKKSIGGMEDEHA